MLSKAGGGGIPAFMPFILNVKERKLENFLKTCNRKLLVTYGIVALFLPRSSLTSYLEGCIRRYITAFWLLLNYPQSMLISILGQLLTLLDQTFYVSSDIGPLVSSDNNLSMFGRSNNSC
jgi:hypothetical protein